MPLRIVNNIYSLNAQRQISKSQLGLSKAFERLSSGLRINRAGDDAAGLAISEKLRSNIKALQQASRNASDGIGLVQTAEGAMEEISSMLIRMKELAAQASTGTVTDAERGYLNQEYTALRNEITRIANATKFNETKLLDGSLDVDIQIGLSNSSYDKINVQLDSVTADDLSVPSGIDTISNALSALTSIGDAIETLASTRAGLGAIQNRLESVLANLNTVTENLTDAESRIRDADIAAETANLTKFSVLVQAGIAVLAQANQMPSMVLNLLS